MKRLTTGAISILFVLAMAAVFADSMRCGGSLVGIGDSEYEVVRKCGQPSYKQGNRWIYDRGSQRFLRILNFGNGKLLSIEEERLNT